MFGNKILQLKKVGKVECGLELIKYLNSKMGGYTCKFKVLNNLKQRTHQLSSKDIRQGS
jgi:hypothetical protein